MGRPPKPTAIKALEGYRGHRRPKVDPQPPPIPLERPDDLSEAAAAEWDLALEAAPAGLLTAMDRPTLAIYAGAMAEYRRAAEIVARSGPLVAARRDRSKRGDGTPELVVNPAIRVARDQARLVLQAGAQLGMSPVARARLAQPVEKQGDDLEWIFSGPSG